MSDAVYGRGVVRPAADAGFAAGFATFKRMSWGAVFAGLFIVLAIQFLFSLLGFGVGLHLVQPASGGGADAGSIGIGAVVWWVVTYLIALIVGCYAAAWLAGATRGFDGALHGVVTWALALTVSLFFMTTAIGGLIGGALGLVGNSLQAAAPAVVGAAGPMIGSQAGDGQNTGDQVQGMADDLLRRDNNTGLSADQARSQIVSDIRRYAAGGADAQQAREDIIDIMASQLNISHDEAAQRFDQWNNRVQQAKNQATEAAERAAKVAGQAALWGFVALVLGAIFSALGGGWGAHQLGREQSEEVYR